MPTQVRASLAQRARRGRALEVGEPGVCPVGDGQALERLLAGGLGSAGCDDVWVLPCAGRDGRPLRGQPDLRLALRRKRVRRGDARRAAWAGVCRVVEARAVARPRGRSALVDGPERLPAHSVRPPHAWVQDGYTHSISRGLHGIYGTYGIAAKLAAERQILAFPHGRADRQERSSTIPPISTHPIPGLPLEARGFMCA